MCDGPGLGPRRPEFDDARGRWTYSAPVVVLVDRFSVSMAEGLAMALSGLGRARHQQRRTTLPLRWREEARQLKGRSAHVDAILNVGEHNHGEPFN